MSWWFGGRLLWITCISTWHLCATSWSWPANVSLAQSIKLWCGF